MADTDGPSNELEQFQEELSSLLRRRQGECKLKMLNGGTSRNGEYHWRFKIPSGQIVSLQMEIES